MKRILALGLASAMVLSMGAIASAAKNDEAHYPVGSISKNAFEYDNDTSSVDMSNPLESIAYGDTMYFPLLNNVTNEDLSAAITAAEALLAERVTAYGSAVTSHDQAVTNAAEKAAAVVAADALLVKANAVKAAADAWNDVVTAGGDTTETMNAYIAALAAFDTEAVPADTAPEAVTASGALVTAQSQAAQSAKTEETAANGLVVTRNDAVRTAETARNEAQKSLDDLKATSFGYVHESDAVDGIKLKQKWETGAKFVDNVEIAKKKVTGITIDQKYLYFVAVSLKENSTMSANDLTGTISLRKSGSFDYDEMELDINMELSYPHATDTVITEDLQIFKEGEGFVGEDDEEFTFEADSDSYMVVNTIGQSKLLIAVTSDFNAEIADLYPNANLDFFYGNGATFNKTGTLYLAANEDSYLYKVNERGNLEKVDAEYDEYDEAFAIRTKTLGKYIISDTELELVEKPTNNDNSNNNNNGGTVTVVPNPGTGASV